MRNINKENKIIDKCIWMASGIVNYKLCDKNFDCENCEFDKGMQGFLPVNRINHKQTTQVKKHKIYTLTEPLNQYFLSLLSNCKIHLDRCYYPPLLWYKVDEDDNLTVGVDELLIKIMDPISKIVLPEIDHYYQSGQLVGWIVRKDKIYPLHSPFDGKILAVNNHINENGSKSQDDLFLFKMRCKEAPIQFYQKCINLSGIQFFFRFINMLKENIGNFLNRSLPENVGLTMTDGGKFVTTLETAIGEMAFQNLLEIIFSDK